MKQETILEAMKYPIKVQSTIPALACNGLEANSDLDKQIFLHFLLLVVSIQSHHRCLWMTQILAATSAQKTFFALRMHKQEMLMI